MITAAIVVSFVAAIAAAQAVKAIHTALSARPACKAS
jgi:hypothetical protein